MRIIIKSLLSAGLFACLLTSIMQAKSVSTPTPPCLRSHGSCLELTCTGVCNASCVCVR
jgi:hypothetical protein